MGDSQIGKHAWSAVAKIQRIRISLDRVQVSVRGGSPGSLERIRLRQRFSDQIPVAGSPRLQYFDSASGAAG
ncbi:MAG: hypothetical protein ABSH50_29260, partial [Bryobacteraceae bacterium]